MEVRGMNAQQRGLAINKTAKWWLELKLQDQTNLTVLTDQLCGYQQVADHL